MGKWEEYYFQLDLRPGKEVRSKRHSNMNGRILRQDSSLTYSWLVSWDGGDTEWCRDGELRPTAEDLEKRLDEIIEKIVQAGEQDRFL